ncbi:MAG: hypothetical protein ACUVX1_03580 [Chloroflexota bacterium]
MDDVLDEAAAIVQCKECPWYRSCVLPIRVTPEDVRRQWQSAMPGMGIPGGDFGMSQMLANMTQMAQNSILEGCPVFIQRLRSSPRLAERVKRLMQTWGQEDGEDYRIN